MNTFIVTYQVEYSTGIRIFNANNIDEVKAYKEYKEISIYSPHIAKVNTIREGLVYTEE